MARASLQFIGYVFLLNWCSGHSKAEPLDPRRTEFAVDVNRPSAGREVPLKDLGRDKDFTRICRRGDIVNAQITDEPDPQCLEETSKAIKKGHPDQYLTTPEIVKKYGYKVETHEVKTDDGYFLTLYRLSLLNRGNHRDNITRYPVYMQHGLVSASDTWFCQPPQRTLVFQLVDAGYDVWLSNSRGTTYSKKHERLSFEKDLEYWDFSFHELGVYDVPAVTKKVLEKTGFRKILYIGYSMGTTEYLITLAEKPEMNEKFAAAFLITPTAFMGHGTSALHDIAKYLQSEQSYRYLSKAIGGRLQSARDLHELIGINQADVCALSAARCGLCDNFWFYFHGYNPNQMNRSAIPLFLSKMGNSAAVKLLSHYAQLVVSCRFQKYSYDVTKNLKIYGTATPPEYNLGNIRVPLFMYFSRFDNFVPLKDIYTLMSRMNKGVVHEQYLIKDEYFTHMDFGMGKDADKIVYAKILKDMSKFDLMRPKS